MLTKLKSEIGGAMLAVLLLVPVITAGSLAVYLMATTSTNTTMHAALEEDGIFSSSSVADVVVGTIMNNSVLRTQMKDTAEGSYLPGLGAEGAVTLSRTGTSRYRNMVTLYKVKKLQSNEFAEGVEPNTIALEITTRTYNQANPAWDDGSYVEHRTYQEFNEGIIKIVGCAANYDIFAGRDYEQKQLMDFEYFKNTAYYAGNQWRSCGFSAPFSGWLSSSCVDALDLPKISINRMPALYSQYINAMI